MFAQNSYPTLNTYGQSLLLKWHRQDPVSQKEIDRNNAVYSFQGNRNPFIDYPNMVEYIWGDSTNYEFSFSGQSTSAPSISISNDKIEFGYIGTETSKDKEIYIKGKNLTTDITAKLLNNDSGDFSLGMSNLPVHELNTTGINLAITFSPRSIGTRNVTLRLSSDELSAPVDITISGTVLLSDASYLRIIDIKSTYKKSDEPVRLMLNMNLDTQWTVDGKPATHLTPSELSAGLHTIQFTTIYGTGTMRVQIIEEKFLSIMTAAQDIRYILTIATALLFFSACKDDKNESQPTDFILRVDESVSIKLPNSTSYTIMTNNSAISYELSGKILTVTAIKEGKATLTVILDSGESHNYSFTISANSYQMGFTIDSTPRIESWISGSTVKTEETAGLQVSCEPGMDITGSPTGKSTRSYGFTYVETGKLLRFSAQGDFSQKGILNNGIMATRDNDNTPIQYETCTVSIEKVNDAGKIWFTLQFTDRSDIRIVTEIF